MSQIFKSVGTSEGEECSICHQVIQGLKNEYHCDGNTVTLCDGCNKYLDDLQYKLYEAEEVVSMRETEYFKELDRVFEHATE